MYGSIAWVGLEFNTLQRLCKKYLRTKNSITDTIWSSKYRIFQKVHESIDQSWNIWSLKILCLFNWIAKTLSSPFPKFVMIRKCYKHWPNRCTEIPNPQQDPYLYEIVEKYMIHGPCGQLNTNTLCMVEGRCSKKYPRAILRSTQTVDDCYP